jgi:DNA-binding transcriptional LysR family regulator
MPVDDLIKRLPRQLKMSELRVFVAVLEHGSFRKAAAVLHLTQPAVTKAICGLEELLGAKLFHRATHGVEPTVHGSSFARHAAAIFEQLRLAAQDLDLVSGGARGSLRVGIVPMPAIPFLPVALERILSSQPGILVTVVEEREAELVARLRKRDIDVAILRLALVEPDADMQAAFLFEERLCVIAGRDHRLAARQSLTWDELRRESWVVPPADCHFYEHVFGTLARAGLAMPRRVVEAMSINIQFGMVMHGGLLSFGMRSQAVFAPGKEFLVRLPFELPSSTTAVAAVSLKSRHASPLVQRLVDEIRGLAAVPRSPADAALASA